MKFLFALVTQRWHKSFQVFDTERYWKAYCGGFFFACFLRNAEACILKILSSSNRGGGVAPDCMDFALKVSFPWLQAPFRFRSVKIRLCLPTTSKHDTTETTTTTRPAEGSQAARRRRSIFEMSTYLIVDSTLCDGVFITNFGFLIFPSLSDYFPPGELIRTLASEK